MNLIKKVTSFVLLLGFLTQVNASDLYVFVSDTQLKSDNGKSAKLFMGVPVSVQKEKGSSVNVIVHGFQDGLNIYSSVGKELLIATLEDGFNVTKKSGNEVELIGFVEKENLTDNAPEIWEEHEEFYFEMCTQCHAAAKVAHHTMIEWEALFGAMRGFAKLDNEESDYLLRYLKSNASNGLIKVKH